MSRPCASYVTDAEALFQVADEQGYANYELGFLPIFSMLNPLRPRLMLTAMALLFQRQRQFAPRLPSEREAMRSANDIMGRTLWDRAQAKALSPEARYHHCARILRDEFYNSTWAGTDCEPFSIFIGNGASPRKGAHVAVMALAQLLREFPQATLHIAGQDPRKLPWRSPKRHVGYLQPPTCGSGPADRPGISPCTSAPCRRAR